jgi:YidC/Oxa1 family membrane protein insertase
MDRKSIIGIIFAIAGLVAWQVHYTRQMQEYQAKKAAYEAEMARIAEEKAKAEGGAAAGAAPSGTASAVEAQATPAPPPIEETTEKLSTGAVEYIFSNLGGGIQRVTFLDHMIDKGSQQRVMLNEFGSIPIGAVTDAAGEKTRLPFEMRANPTERSVVFERVDEKQIALTKKFILPRFENLKGRERLREEYLLKLDITFSNRGSQPVAIPPFWVHTGAVAPLHFRDAPYYIGLNYLRGTGNKFINVTWFQAGGFLMFKHGPRPVYPEKPEPMDDIRWVAASNQYFTSMIGPVVEPTLPTEDQRRMRGTGIWARDLWVPIEQWKAAGRDGNGGRGVHGVDGAIQLSGFQLAPNQSETRRLHVLAGPSEYRRLRELNDYEAELLDFGFFGLISKGLLNSLNALKAWLGSYWAAIMVLTIIIRSAMWPLQNRATATAKKMAALSPKLKDLQERYKDDPMRMQQETSKLWKQHGINPIGGCLPMLVQIPIFFGFYNMLNKAVELRNNGFLWVQDLSQPDTVARIFGLPLNPLPLVMAATMVLQMKLTPKAGDPMQQRIMMFMPLIFIALCYNYASALALYWTVQNIFSIFQLYVTRDKPLPAAEVIPPAPAPAKKKR